MTTPDPISSTETELLGDGISPGDGGDGGSANGGRVLLLLYGIFLIIVAADATGLLLRRYTELWSGPGRSVAAEFRKNCFASLVLFT